jgi:hypothetical protein
MKNRCQVSFPGFKGSTFKGSEVENLKIVHNSEPLDPEP